MPKPTRCGETSLEHFWAR